MYHGVSSPRRLTYSQTNYPQYRDPSERKPARPSQQLLLKSSDSSRLGTKALLARPFAHSKLLARPLSPEKKVLSWIACRWFLLLREPINLLLPQLLRCLPCGKFGPKFLSESPNPLL